MLHCQNVACLSSCSFRVNNWGKCNNYVPCIATFVKDLNKLLECNSHMGCTVLRLMSSQCLFTVSFVTQIKRPICLASHCFLYQIYTYLLFLYDCTMIHFHSIHTRRSQAGRSVISSNQSQSKLPETSNNEWWMNKLFSFITTWEKNTIKK